MARALQGDLHCAMRGDGDVVTNHERKHSLTRLRPRDLFEVEKRRQKIKIITGGSG
jgi:hypothetical protein